MSQKLNLKEVPAELSSTSLPQTRHKPTGMKIAPREDSNDFSEERMLGNKAQQCVYWEGRRKKFDMALSIDRARIYNPVSMEM